MTQLQVEIVNPRAGRLLQELAAMNLIVIRKPRSQSDTASSLVDVAGDVESVRKQESVCDDAEMPLPEGFNPLLLGKIPLSRYGSIEILGDIISPIDVEWDAMR